MEISSIKQRGRQKGQTKDVVVIKDIAFAPYEIHQDKNCYTLMEPGSNDMLNTIGYFSTLQALLPRLANLCMVDQKGVYSTLREYIKDYNKIVENLKQVINI
jgi:hypothetical protein